MAPSCGAVQDGGQDKRLAGTRRGVQAWLAVTTKCYTAAAPDMRRTMAGSVHPARKRTMLVSRCHALQQNCCMYACAVAAYAPFPGPPVSAPVNSFLLMPASQSVLATNLPAPPDEGYSLRTLTSASRLSLTLMIEKLPY